MHIAVIIKPFIPFRLAYIYTDDSTKASSNNINTASSYNILLSKKERE